MIGTTLSHYEITAELGRGGMGIVYKARDTKLDRDVAIKVLPSAALASQEDRARFYREAKAAAALNHPNIAAIHQIDEAVPSDAPHGTQPSPFIAMEYIDGQPLEEHIKRAPLKLDEVIKLAGQIASALEAAHDKDIVHRDIKSANVMLTGKGEAKVLDFGLAKTAHSTMLTRMGSTMGTVAYMSPVQARGEEVDARSDLWSLGIVIYEMIAGKLPFTAEYEQAAVYSILNEDPEPLTALRSGVPMDLEYVVNKLLSKDRKHRFQSASDLMADLSALKDASTTRVSTLSTQSVRRAVPGAVRTTKNNYLLIGTGIAGSLLGALVIWMLIGNTTPVPPAGTNMRLSLELPEDLQLSYFGGDGLGLEVPAFALSRDGEKMVYVADSAGTSVLVSHEMGSNEFKVLPSTFNAYYPVFSPDGSSIAYLANETIYTVGFESGRPIPLTSTSDAMGLYWSDDNWIYWSNQQGLVVQRITPSGNLDSKIIAADICRCYNISQGIEYGDVLVSGINGAFHISANGETNQTKHIGVNSIVVDSKYMVSVGTGSLIAGGIAFIEQTDEVDLGKVVLSDVRTSSIGQRAHFAVSDDGTLMYALGKQAGLTRLVVRSPNGEIQTLPFEAQSHGHMDATRDGSKIAVHYLDGTDRLMVYDLERQTATPFLQESNIYGAIWNEGGTAITYSHTEGDSSSVMTREVNSSRGSEVLLTGQGNLTPSDWSSDNRFLIYSQTIGSFSRLGVLDTMDSTSTTIIELEGRAWSGKFSPDDSLIAYTHIAGQGSEVFVEPFPPTKQRWNVSSGIGEEPEWREDTNELIFRGKGAWFSVSYETDPPVFGTPRYLFEGPYVNISGLEYRVLSRGDVLLQEAVNKEFFTNRLEVITNFNSVVREVVDSTAR